MIDLVVYIAVAVILFVLVYWLLKQFPLPPPLGQIVNIVLVVIAVLVIIGILLSVTGHGPPLRLR
jgi:heme A synthase